MPADQPDKFSGDDWVLVADGPPADILTIEAGPSDDEDEAFDPYELPADDL